MTKPHGANVKKNDVASLSKGVENVQQNSVFGMYSDKEMIAQLRRLALDPCKPQFAKDNIQSLWNQILRLRKVMVLEDSEIPWRKRKLEQFVKDKLKSPPDFDVLNQQKLTKPSRRRLSHASSPSYLLNSVDSTQRRDETTIILDSHTSSSLLTFDGSLPKKHTCTEFSFVDDMVRYASSTLDTNGSVNGSSNANRNSNSPTLSGTHTRHPRRSIKLPNFITDHVQKKVMPVGPHFQADIPEWAGPLNRSTYNSDPNNSKWLGFQVWPIGTENVKTTSRTIGKGRPDSCPCVPSGSADCVRHHTLENRLLLQCELGPAFFSWKFDEMGEQVSTSWTLKEQKTFESLVKTRPSSTFLKRALKCFKRKDRKDIVNYYFSVYIPKRTSLYRSLPSVKQVNTDDEDEDEASNNMGSQNGYEGSCKDVKVRFLRS